VSQNLPVRYRIQLNTARLVRSVLPNILDYWNANSREL